MLVALVSLVGGGVLLYLGAEWLVGGGARLALALRIPQLLVGLTIVAFGTSAPEVVVGFEAAAAGHGTIAVGNVIGSNIANIGLILGLSCMLTPPQVDGALQRRELPMLALTALAVPLVVADGVVSRGEGLGLVGSACVYTLWVWRAARSGSMERAEVVSAAADAAGAPDIRRVAAALTTAAVGLVALVFGGKQFVSGAIALAEHFAISERIIGLTVVAVGTSLPELITSVVAARRGHSDIVVGNVIGSNIFNVLVCLGAAAVAHPLQVSAMPMADTFAGVGFTVVAIVFMRTQRRISRLEGAVALALYVGFISFCALS